MLTKFSTDNIWRPIIYSYYELTEEQQEQVDQDYDWDVEQSGPYFADSLGYVYHFSDFYKLLPHPVYNDLEWHAVLYDSAYTGIFIRVSNDSDEVMIGRSFSS